MDSDVSKITALREGRAPFFEPGLADILLRTAGSGKLRSGTSLAEAGQFGEVHFTGLGRSARCTSPDSAEATLRAPARPVRC